MSEYTGQLFAGYEIIARLGQGGMGTVYKARQPKLDRFVALKVMSSDLAKDPDFVARFRREATAAASLSHPNVVQVYAAGEHENIPYIAMEFVDGVTLREHIELHGRLDPRESIAVAVYVAQALQFGWNRAKLIHRDIKPENIFLSKTGEVKVGDLGLAKTVGGVTTSLTQTGMMMGSPHYISPEQARGDGDIDFRADIYSLGCTLFHMLTGRPPYTGTDPLSVISKHVNDPPPAIFKVWPTCPIPLALVMGRMLAKHRHERPESYEDLIEQLQAVHDKLASAGAAAPAPAAAPVKTASTSKPPGLKPVVVRATTARPAPASTKRPVAGIWKWVLAGTAGLAAIAVTAGAVWWWAGRRVETKVLDLGDGVTMKLSVIPSGEFLLGSTREEQVWAVANDTRREDMACEGEQPRKARIPQSFWLGQTEVTVGQWRQFAKATGYVTEAERKAGPAGGSDHPQRAMGPAAGLDWRNPERDFTPPDNQAVTWISWDDAMAFCMWLDQRERATQRLPTGWRVRLPSEVEWEYACRAGTQTRFWWGDPIEDGKGRLNTKGNEDGFDFVAPVDSYGARGRNRFGLGDMLGNAREWCLDEFDPAGAHAELWTGNAPKCVARGGCAFRGLAASRCAFRESLNRHFRAHCSGFRVLAGPDLGAAFAALMAKHDGETPAGKGSASLPKSITLFDGHDTLAWQQRGGRPCQWQVTDGALVVGEADIDTLEKFQDFGLHVEFAVSRDPKQGNSGVYLQGRYEVQILDSFGKPADDKCCGAIFGIQAPAENVSRQPDEWQSFDITFYAARFAAAGSKTANARVSVVLNGRLILNNVQIPRSTGKGDPESAAPGPIRLQAYGSPVRFRNIRITPLGPAERPRQTVDLLAVTDPVKDRVTVKSGASHSKGNTWERRNRALAYISDGGSGKLAPPVAIRARSYEIEVEFERLSGQGRFHVDLPLDGRRIIPVTLDDTHIKMVKGPGGGPWPADHGPRARIVVALDRSPDDKQDRITVRLDRRLVMDWQGDAAMVAQNGEPHPGFPDEPVTSLYSHQDSYEVRLWQLRVFDGQATVLRSAATADTASQGVINLLPLIDPQKDAVAGDWKLMADGLVLEKPKGAGVLDLPYAPPEEYDFEVEFTPQSDGRNVNQYLVAAGSSFAWKLNAYGQSPPIYGLDLLDGKLAKDRDEAVVQNPLMLKPGQRYTSKIEIRRGSLRALVNGGEFLQWSGDFSRLSLEGIYRLHGGRHLGVGSYQRGVIFHRIVVREVAGKGSFARDTPKP